MEEGQKEGIERQTQSIILSLILAAILGLFAFVWNINGTMIEIKTESRLRYQAIEKQNDIIEGIKRDLEKLRSEISEMKNKP